MRLDEVVNNIFVEVATIHDLDSEIDYSLQLKRCNTRKGSLPQFIAAIKKGEDTVGYTSFLTDLKGSLVFKGMEVLSKYRGQGLAHALIESLFQLADNDGCAVTKTKRQRKPITTYILIGYGFTPFAYPEKSKVDILKPKQEGKVRIRFRDSKAKMGFMSSRLYKSGQYDVVTDNFENPIRTVVIGKTYSLTNLALCEDKRKINQERFKFNFSLAKT